MGESCREKLPLRYSTGLHLGNKQSNITTDLETQSSEVNDNSFSLASDCCSIRFFYFYFFFSVYSPGKICKVIRGKV